MWNIFIPVQDNDGNRFDEQYMDSWFNMAATVSGGLTILSESIGKYTSDQYTYEEPILPVLLYATKNDLVTLATVAKNMFKQETVLFYKVSDDVYFI